MYHVIVSRHCVSSTHSAHLPAQGGCRGVVWQCVPVYVIHCCWWNEWAALDSAQGFHLLAAVTELTAGSSSRRCTLSTVSASDCVRLSVYRAVVSPEAFVVCGVLWCVLCCVVYTRDPVPLVCVTLALYY